MTFADLNNQLLLQGPALARLTEEEFYDLCQHNALLRLERTADRSRIAKTGENSRYANLPIAYGGRVGRGSGGAEWASLRHKLH